MEIVAERTTIYADIVETPPPERVMNFVHKVIHAGKSVGKPSSRVYLRYPIALPVRATPLNKHRKPSGEACLGLTRDISSAGLSMYLEQPVKEKLLRLEITSPKGEQLKVLLVVARCQAAGPFYEIAGQFRVRNYDGDGAKPATRLSR